MKLIAPVGGLQIDGASEVQGALDVSQSMAAPAAAIKAISGSAANFAGGRLGSLVSGGPGAMLGNLLSGGLNAGALTSMIEAGLPADVCGSLVSAGLDAGGLADLSDIASSFSVESLSGVIGDAAGAAGLGNVLKSGFNLSSLTSLASANLNLGSLSSIIGNAAGASGLGNLIQAGLNGTALTSIVSAGLNVVDLEGLAGGVLDGATKNLLQAAGLSLPALNDLLGSGLNASFLVNLIEGGSEGLGQLLDVGLDGLGDMLKAGLDGNMLGNLLGDAREGIESLLSSSVSDKLGDLFQSGLTTSALAAISSLDSNELRASAAAPQSAADSLRALTSTPAGAAILDSMVEGATSSSVTVDGSKVLTEATLPPSDLSVHLTGDVIGYGRVQIKPGGLASLIVDTVVESAGEGTVSSFNGRTGSITLTNTDIATALGYVPVSPTTVIANAAFATTAGNADLLNNQPGSYYLDLGNATGTLASGRLSGTYAINISGNAATATFANTATFAQNSANAVYANTAGYTTTANTANFAGRLNTARVINLTGAVTGNVAFDGSANVSIVTTLGAAAPIYARNATDASLRLQDNSDTTRAYIVGSAAGQGFVTTDGAAWLAQFTSTTSSLQSSALTLAGNAVWNSGNDGAGSGLDADLLDGYHGSAFARMTEANLFTIAQGFVSNVVGAGWTNHGLAVRETNQVGATQSSSDYDPGIAFYWAGRTAERLHMDSVGTLRWGSNYLLTSGNIANFGFAALAGANFTGPVKNTNNINAEGPNFVSDTVNKDIDDYAFVVRRSGVNVGGITNDGRGFFTAVGIGMTNPAAQLEVGRNTGGTLAISTAGVNGTNAAPIAATLQFLGYTDKVKGAIRVEDREGNAWGGWMSIQTRNGADDTLKDRITIDNAGAVNVLGSLSVANNSVWHSGNFNPANYAAISSSVRFGDVMSRIGTGGYVNLSPGSADNTGYVEFYKANGVRVGYIGFAPASGIIAVSGAYAFAERPSFSGQTPWDSGNFNPTNYVTASSVANPVAHASLSRSHVGYTNDISLLGQSDGGLYVSAYSDAWQHQIVGDFRTGQMAIRGKQSGAWQPWRTVMDNLNRNEFPPYFTVSPATADTNAAMSTLAEGGMSFQRFGLAATNKPETADNANGVLSMHSHDGPYGKQLAFSSGLHLYLRNVVNGSYGPWNKIVHDGWFNPVGGSGASGTWPINVTGSALILRPQPIYSLTTSTAATAIPDGVTTNFVSSGEGWDSYGSVLNVKAYTGGGGGTLQLYVPYGPGLGGTALRYRMCEYNGTTDPWGPFRTIWDTGNFNPATKLNTSEASVDVVNNTLVRRNSSGYIYSNYFNMTANQTDTAASRIAVENSSDGFLRWQTPARFITNHGIWSAGTIPVNTWHTTNDANQRFYFQNGAETYYKASAHYLRNQSDVNVMSVLSSGAVSATASFTAPSITATSDARLKTNVTTLTDAVALVNRLRPVRYDRLDTNRAGIGFIAQEFQEVLPELVIEGEDEDKTLSIEYGQVTALLTSVVQQLLEKNAELEARLDAAGL